MLVDVEVVVVLVDVEVVVDGTQQGLIVPAPTVFSLQGQVLATP